MTVRYFDSIGAFCATLDGLDESIKTRHSADSFTNNQTFDDALVNLRNGRLDNVKKSDKLLSKMQGDSIELEVPQWEHAVAGFIPCVPSFLAGSPESMRRPVQTSSDRSPIKVYASVCLSAGFTAKQIEQRGVVLLALARKLQMIRPVELWVFADLHGTDMGDGTGNCAIPVIKIETMPLDLPTATYALSDAGFLRQLCFAWGRSQGFGGQWAWCSKPDLDSYQERLREVLKVGDADLLISGSYLSNQIAHRPLEFINEQIARFTEHLEAA